MGGFSSVMRFVAVGEGFQMLLSVDGHCDCVECASERISESIGALGNSFVRSVELNLKSE